MLSSQKLTSAAAPGLRQRRTQKRYMRSCISFRATGLPPYDENVVITRKTIFSTGFPRRPGVAIRSKVFAKKVTSAAAPGLRKRRTQKRYMRACITCVDIGLATLQDMLGPGRKYKYVWIFGWNIYSG